LDCGPGGRARLYGGVLQPAILRPTSKEKGRWKRPPALCRSSKIGGVSW
jgi:hypothetical protein